jgi:outer membrane protein assembly factor BamB
VLHAWDGMTGRELWNSGKTIPSSVTSPSFWSGTGQVYVGTSDGTVYAFGFAMERK